jgi:hypothetical protein
VDANFKFKTLSDDDPRTLDDNIVQDMPRGLHYINKPPNKFHMIHGDFDNNPPIDIKNFRSRPLRGGVNGIPKNNRPSSKSSRFDPSNRPYPRDKEGHDRQVRNALLRTLKSGSFKKK